MAAAGEQQAHADLRRAFELFAADGLELERLDPPPLREGQPLAPRPGRQYYAAAAADVPNARAQLGIELEVKYAIAYGSPGSLGRARGRVPRTERVWGDPGAGREREESTTAGVRAQGF